jgi:hypothetical protein
LAAPAAYSSPFSLRLTMSMLTLRTMASLGTGGAAMKARAPRSPDSSASQKANSSVLSGGFARK